MFHKATLSLTALFKFMALPDAAEAQRSPTPKNASIYIIWPSDGQVISGEKIWVRFGSRNVGISPAGVEFEKIGHHHLIVDAELPPMDEPVPFNKNHLHFGAGQTEARLELPPGRRTLQMLLANHVHDLPVVSKRITITVPK